MPGKPPALGYISAKTNSFLNRLWCSNYEDNAMSFPDGTNKLVVVFGQYWLKPIKVYMSSSMPLPSLSSSSLPSSFDVHHVLCWHRFDGLTGPCGALVLHHAPTWYGFYGWVLFLHIDTHTKI